MNSVYYKLYKNKKGFITIVCMQWFDEVDYIKSKFVTDHLGNDYKFDTEEEAIDNLNKWFEFFEIDPEFRKDTNLVR